TGRRLPPSWPPTPSPCAKSSHVPSAGLPRSWDWTSKTLPIPPSVRLPPARPRLAEPQRRAGQLPITGLSDLRKDDRLGDLYVARVPGMRAGRLADPELVPALPGGLARAGRGGR